MMKTSLKINGIYDLRTIKFLKSLSITHFTFDFSPKSFNFLQEHVFLGQILKVLSSSDKIFLHFARSNDPMITKIVSDLLLENVNLDNVFFEIDEWSEEVPIGKFRYNFLLNYGEKNSFNKIQLMNNQYFCGFNFSFELLSHLKNAGVLNNFIQNFYTNYSIFIADSTFISLNLDWNSNIFNSVFELLDFNLISLPINSKIEVCYRNVDLNLMTKELKHIQSTVQA